MYNTRFVVITILLVALIAVGITYLVMKPDLENDAITPTPTAMVTPIGYRTPTPTPQRLLIRLTSAGVTPSTVSVRVGDMVTFRNDTDLAFWPLTVTGDGACSGLDATRSLRRGESYSLTFNELRTCRYLNHADESNASQHGTVIVR